MIRAALLALTLLVTVPVDLAEAEPRKIVFAYDFCPSHESEIRSCTKRMFDPVEVEIDWLQRTLFYVDGRFSHPLGFDREYLADPSMLPREVTKVTYIVTTLEHQLRIKTVSTMSDGRVFMHHYFFDFALTLARA